MPKTAKYKRILLKLTGEMLGGEDGKGLDFASIEKTAEYISKVKNEFDIELAIVIGGGNLFRGRQISDPNADKATYDYIGMLGTIMNALALQEALERFRTQTRVMSSLESTAVCEPFIRRRAVRHLEKGRIVLLAGGTGNPFFTTDSAAALRACELKCEVILKGSHVEGVFSADPNLEKDAMMYEQISHQFALEKGLMVMDNTAFALCQREQIPIIVFNVQKLENIAKILSGEKVGTLIK